MSVQSLERAFTLLEILGQADQPLGISEIATDSLLPLATVHRLLQTLTQLGYVEKDLDTHRYTLGVKFLHLRGAVIDYVHLASQAMPIMKNLVHRLDETVHLAVLNKGEVIYIERVEGFQTQGMYTRIGKRHYAHCTALGKAMLAYQSEDVIDSMIEQHGLPRFSSNTITTKNHLVAELDCVRQRGYAVDNGETAEPVRCIAAPIRDYSTKVIAAVSVSGPINKITPVRDAEISQAVCNAANRISQQLGYRISPM
jgi:IclR family transcriptional regulator, KDG regulon repressor